MAIEVYRYKTEGQLRRMHGAAWRSRTPGWANEMITALCGRLVVYDPMFYCRIKTEPSSEDLFSIAIDDSSFYVAPWMVDAEHPEPAVCSICGAAIESYGDLFIAGDKMVCSSCRSEGRLAVPVAACDRCGGGPVAGYNTYHTRSTGEALIEVVAGVASGRAILRHYCPACTRRATIRCEGCGRRYTPSPGRGGYCAECATRHVFCAECGAIIDDENYQYYDEEADETLCRSCYEERERRRNQVIREHDYKPTAIMHGEGPLYLGIELEVDQGGNANNSARRVQEAIGKDHIYIKYDGSLRGESYEMVTHPASLGYILSHREIYDNMLTIPKEDGFSSHDAGSCGLHVHVSRAYFDPDEAIGLLYLFERLWPEMVKFSRRNASQIENWAKRYCSEGEITDPHFGLDGCRGKIDGDRYMAVNYQNAHTVEFRLWRGTLNPETFYATLQLVDNLCRFVKGKDVPDLQRASFLDIIHYSDYPELSAYVARRFPSLENLHSPASRVGVDSDRGESEGEETANVPYMDGFEEPLPGGIDLGPHSRDRIAVDVVYRGRSSDFLVWFRRQYRDRPVLVRRDGGRETLRTIDPEGGSRELAAALPSCDRFTIPRYLWRNEDGSPMGGFDPEWLRDRDITTYRAPLTPPILYYYFGARNAGDVDRIIASCAAR